MSAGRFMRAIVTCVVGLLPLAHEVAAQELRVAVAANFRSTFEELAELYAARGPMAPVASYAATGVLYTQIVNGAPFDALLSADAERPIRLVEEGHGLRDTRFTYAVGRVALWVPGATPSAPVGAPWLEQGHRLAIANPEIAPYGVAAEQVLRQLGLWDDTKPRLVMGESIGQTMAFVATGGVPGGFVAYSELRAIDAPAADVWIVPHHLHDPIEQQAVALRRGNVTLARAFLEFLRGPEARVVIERYGYAIPDP